MVMNSDWFPRIAYIYEKKYNKETAQVDVQKENVLFTRTLLL